MPRLNRLLWIPAFVVALTRPAYADDVSLAYDVAAECPNQTAFEIALKTRGVSLKSSSAEPSVVALKVQVVQREGGYFGTLQVSDKDGVSAEREVHAAECAEVIKGLAVVTAIALGAPGEPVQPPAAAPVATPPPRVTLSPVGFETRPHLRGSSFRREKEIEVQAGKLRLDLVRAYDLRAGASFNLVPGLVLPRYDFNLGVTNFLTPPGGESRVIGPILEVGWSWIGPGTLHIEGYSSEVYGLASGVRSCSALTYDIEGFIFNFCGEFGLAWLRLKTKNAEGTYLQKKSTGLGTAGLSLALEYNLGSHFHVGLRAAGQIQLGSVSAERPGGGTLWQMPLLGAYAVGGVGVHFW